ncbi:aspartyl protease family protein [Treponema sp. OMZ 792]|uniref:aspartyl protease family protein n=1 Tax=unclassified Treponema TaxID=2638727 RepID=UPI0020A56310|nr:MULTISPECIES: aspartyl protease family protein [unclassified Treponema]UTC74479.1 aspartyl protease family protein [Treponema sp. OMZ 792]UTC80875.1 hypothetical protein E4O07_09585 [Treponema sp. OMZ 798]
MKRSQCKLIKILSFFLIFLFVFSSVFAQNEAECEKIVQIAMDCCNEKSLTKILPYLSEDFSVAGHSGNLAEAIFKQLVSAVGSIVSYNKKESRLEADKLILEYSIEYSQVGKKDSVFIFNKDNLLTGAELMKIKVKTLSPEERTVEYNKANLISVPIILAGNIPLVEVFLNGENRLFFLDSGAPFSILNSKYVEGLNKGQKKLGSLQDVTGNTSISNMDIAAVKELEFAGSKIKNQKMVTLDMSSLEKSLETDGIYGLIGYDMLKEYDFFLDYSKKTLVLINPDHIDDFIKNNKLKTNSKLSCKMIGHIPMIEVLIGNKAYQMGIDTGAETNLIDSTYFNDLEYLLQNKQKDVLGGAAGIKKEIYTGELKKLIVGKNVYKNLRTSFSDISHLRKRPESYDGLLGYPFLSSQPVLISYKRGEVILFK